ncbi:HWE histidine kinase domain-containing protein [Flavivirga jejuensis]|uniref:histidine kinase n=1 Tax=Flavivirga jejuensis TaxID=870487 RepID=A0ABT8WIT5_9FLAO|nr:HWE histidine kinase domain-containing protein [Flavivirga jejuensis]MDO5972909.1 HWE histidine kinase domain-containing protein [Flavivirga jejuensis]
MNFKKEIQNSKASEAKALEECNNEPIEFPGIIQSYGALVAFNFNSLAITYASENLNDYFDFEVDNLFNLSIRDLFDRESFHAISNIASHKSTYQQREQAKIIVLKEQKVDISLFRVDENVVIEITPIIESVEVFKINAHLKWTLDTIKKLENVNAILNQSVIALRNITQFDRVKAYKFHPDNSGEVIAEFNSGRMDSYLGLHFPAFDIPPKAREIFLKTPIRHIHNTSDAGVKLKSANKTLKPLNLTLGILRGNSPIHGQYLKNMQVSSTLTLPIIIKGKLWGLFALHNQDVKQLSSEVTYSLELIGQIAGTILEQKIEQKVEKKINKLHLEGEEFITLNQNPIYLQMFWEDYADKLKSLIKCDGVAYQIDKKVLLHGDCPTKNAIDAIATNFSDVKTNNIFYSNNLSELQIKNLDHCRGVLALRIHVNNPKICIYFFRNEIKKNILWAGNPKKDLVFEKEKVRLHPRSSFNEFCDLSKEQSKIWDSETLTLAEIAVTTFQKAVHAEKATTERFKIVIRELNHRIRNILALVRSISKQTINDIDSIDDYANSLEHRILALAKANSLLTENSYTSVELKNLFERIIKPLCNNPENIILEGSGVKITSEIISMMVLIVHELTTNAIKYGSLSTQKGKVRIMWKTNSEGLTIEWKELDGPQIKAPNKTGFGTTIIENAINYEFAGSSKVEFQKDGLYVKFQIPKNLIGESKDSIFVLEQVQQAIPIKKPKKYKVINAFILEDDFIIAQDIKQVISGPKVNKIDAFSNQKQALKSLEDTHYDLAFLDVNLKKETCMKVAFECEKRGVSFYYITGYGNSFLEESTFPKAPVILKPIRTDKLKGIIDKHILNSN